MPSASPFPAPPPLTDDEVDYIDSVLEHGQAVITNFEMMDGFLAALIAGPELLMPSQYFPCLLGGPQGQGTGPSVLADLEEANHFLQLVMQHWNLHVATYMEGKPANLMVNLDSRHQGRDWARGFSIGAELQQGWENVSRAHAGLMDAVMLLANEGIKGGGKKPLKISTRERETMLGAITNGLPLLYAETRPGAAPRRKRPVKRAPRKPRKPKRP